MLRQPGCLNILIEAQPHVRYTHSDVRRFFLTFPAALSLLLLAGVLAAWAFSHFRGIWLSHFSHAEDQSWHVMGRLSQGAVLVYYNHGVCNVAGGRVSFTEWKLRRSPSRLLGSFDALDGSPFPYAKVSHCWTRSYFGVHLKGRREQYGHGHIGLQDRIVTVLVPLWAVAAPFAILPAIWLLRVRHARRRRRLKEGLCTHCGYDLQASTDRCPECGRLFSRV